MRISGSQLTRQYTQPTPSVTTKTTQGLSLNFKAMSISDIPTIRKFLEYNSDRTCDYTLGGIFMWVDYFDYEYCIVKDTLFIKGISENHPGMVAFSLPLGMMPLDEALTMINNYCKEHNIQPAFSAIPVDKADAIAEIYHGRVEKLEGWSDYLYDAKSLATLQGKAYSKKRNHVNRFITDNPNYRFEMITADNIDEAKAFLGKVDLSEKIDRDMAAYELAQCKDVLDNIDLYLFDGAILRSENGEICAVTLGEVVGDTLYVHIEKMDHEVAGAGETINKLFAGEMSERYPEVKYINREEDMNDPGLRYAKESYRPVTLLDKCNVIV